MNQIWFIYIVRCADNSLYTGITIDLKRRINEHNGSNAAKYTRNRQPVELVYFETVDSRASAASREAAIKKLSRKEKENLITNSISGEIPKI